MTWMDPEMTILGQTKTIIMWYHYVNDSTMLVTCRFLKKNDANALIYKTK